MTQETTVGHCKTDETDTYIGRDRRNGELKHIKNTEPEARGWLGNPYRLEDGYSRAESIDKFRVDFYDRLVEDAVFRNAVDQLAGDTLGGWCRTVEEDGPDCHGDVIADYLNGENNE